MKDDTTYAEINNVQKRLEQYKLGIWLISLRQDSHRRERIVRQLRDLSLHFTCFDAVDGNALQSDLIRKADSDAYLRNMGSTLLPGKLGVYASHVAVWEEFVASPHHIALILEDDVVLHDDFLTALGTALANSDLWDLVRFNCVRAKLPVKQAQLGSYSLNAYIGPFTGNSCYLLHRSTAVRILPNLWPQTRAMDHELNRFFHHNYRQMGIEPWSSHPDDGGVSSITGRDFALVKKHAWYKRLPHYSLKAMNYLRRCIWLLMNGMLFRSHILKRPGVFL